MRPPGGSGPPPPPGGPAPPFPQPGPFLGGFFSQFCNTVTSCFYFLCCCWLVNDCFGVPPAPPPRDPTGPAPPPGPPLATPVPPGPPLPGPPGPPLAPPPAAPGGSPPP